MDYLAEPLARDDPSDDVPGQFRLSDEFSSLDPRHIQVELMVGMITWAIVALGALIGLVVAWFRLGFGIYFYVILGSAVVLLAALAIIAWLWPGIEYRRVSYRIDEEGLEIRRGVIWRHSITIPLGRVQHADVSQGPVQRMFGVGTLTVHTAGTQNASINLEGLAYDHAIVVRDFIVHQRKERDAV